MLVDVVRTRSLSGHRVRLRFEDGIEADLELGELIRFDGVFALPREPARLAEFRSIWSWAPSAGRAPMCSTLSLPTSPPT
jgi:hypothetical protein